MNTYNVASRHGDSVQHVLLSILYVYVTCAFSLLIDDLSPELRRSKKNLKHYYMKRVNQRQSTRWPKLGDPTLYMDVTIIRAQYLCCKTKKDVLERLERHCKKHVMGLVDYGTDPCGVTIETILSDGKGEVILIEGDPGSGKTCLTLKICKLWAEEKLLMKEILMWVPLCFFKSATTANNLFELFEKLGCPLPGMKEYAQQNNGEGLVLILDGWDELPNQLQTESLFSDIVFGKSGTFLNSTIIVTSRPTCSGDIAESVEAREMYYQILGFSLQNAIKYIEKYFRNDIRKSAKLLLAFIEGCKYLHRHFYIPITVAIMCFVYSQSENGEIPKTLSKLYEKFVLLYIRSNISSTCCPDIREVSTLKNIPEKLKPLFTKLCKTAFTLLKDHKLVFDEEELDIAVQDLDDVDLRHFDGFGLLYIDHYTSTLATRETSYSFIHRAVQELLAAIYILDTGNISDTLDEHFYVGSYLMNMFPFLFGLVSKELLRPLARKLIQIFNKYDRDDKLLSSILYCLFEAHDETLCHEFGQVFCKKKDVNLPLRTFLECHHAYYFLSVCGGKELNVSMTHDIALPAADDICFEIMDTYLREASTDISSFICSIDTLSQRGTKRFANVLSTQQNLRTVKVECNSCPPGCIKILCDSICRHNSKITNLILPQSVLSTDDLESVGYVIAKSLEKLHLTSYSPDDDGEKKYLNLSDSFYTALCETELLQKLWLSRWSLSQADSEVFGNIISQNCSLKELCINVATADCLDPILNGLSSNTLITTFRAWPSKVSTCTSDTLGQYLKACLTFNRSVKNVDFTTSTFREPSLYISWPPTQVSSICTGLCANTTVVTLDISGCYIDTDACHAVCGMLPQNTTLQHLFLNPVHLEKQHAILMINSCRANATLELLSLVQWPPRRLVSRKIPFEFLYDHELKHLLQEIQALRRESKSLLNVYWLVSAVSFTVNRSHFVYIIGNGMSIKKLRTEDSNFH